MGDSWGYFSRATAEAYFTAGQVVGREVGGKEEGGQKRTMGIANRAPYMAASEEQQHRDGIYTAPRYFHLYAPQYPVLRSLLQVCPHAPPPCVLPYNCPPDRVLPYDYPMDPLPPDLS